MPDHRSETSLTGRIQDPAGQHPLKGRLGRYVHPSHATAGAYLRAQLHRRLEKVHVQAHGPVQLVKLAVGTFAFEAVVAD